MDRKQKRALKIIRRMQKKMDEAVKKSDSEEIERLTKEMWGTFQNISSQTPFVWSSSWSYPVDNRVSIGYDFTQKREEK